MAIVVVSNVLYHVAQRSVGRDLHPLASLFANYGVALALTALLVPFFPDKAPLGPSLRAIQWPSLAVGVSIVGVELGFLLAYRAGWNVEPGGRDLGRDARGVAHSDRYPAVPRTGLSAQSGRDRPVPGRGLASLSQVTLGERPAAGQGELGEIGGP